MSKYRKKPIEIEAIIWKGDNYNDVCVFVGFKPDSIHVTGTKGVRLEIPTLEGYIYASEGDYIIKGIKNELYPCKPDIFEMTYEEVK